MKSLKENLLLYKHKEILFDLCLNFCVFLFGFSVRRAVYKVAS